MASQKFTLTFDAQLNVGQMKGALNQIQSTLNGLHLPQNLSRGLQSTIDSLNKEIQGFEVALGKDITGKADFNKLNNQAQKITDSFEKLKLQVRDLTGLSGANLEKLFPSSVTKNINDATNAIKQYGQQIKSANNEVNTAQQNVNKLTSKLTETQNKTPMTDEAWKQLKTSIAEVEAEVDKYKTAISDAQQTAAEVESRTNNVKQSSIWRQAQKDIETYKQALAEAEGKLKQLTAQRATSTTFTKQAQDIETLNNKLTEAQQKLDAANQALTQLESTSSGGGLQSLATLIGQLTGTDLSGFKGNLEDLGQVIQNYINQQVVEATSKLGQLKTSVDSATPSVQSFGEGMRESADEMQAFNDRTRDISALKSRIQYFFGLNNAVNLVKRAIHGAVDTIKELDAAMTETAVVTDYTVSDMWKQLPEYTKRANELGVTTKAAYESATLYFQQGLNADQAAALSTETLKMARIAGLDAAEATDRMTNALRGFNMELDTASAQRVDDVYSQLAAMSASNVDEISTAMTKVASLAHSTGSEFETTAAFLAQIIETTRESAETAGTALKTVYARFSEVKKLVDTNELKGTDEEGQVVDVNKVSAALRTAGIDLNKYFLGEVGLDDIFMELASKWDSLTSIQQRYIATQAAGSRQQSRFIALMQDYARTQELVGAAYDAEGASARQFEKTQDSLESKLARLKNAWNEFLMGLTNNVMVKTFVDALTLLLNLVNKLTGAFGDGVGSILKWVTAITGLAGLKKAFSDTGIATKAIGSLFKETIFGKLFGFDSGKGEETTANLSLIEKVKAAWLAAIEQIKGAAITAETEESAAATKAEIAESTKATQAEIAESTKATQAGIAKNLSATGAKVSTAAGTAAAAGAGSAGAGAAGAGAAGAGAAGAGLGAVAVPAAIIVAIVAAVIGTVAIQDYIKSGKKQVKDAEKAVEVQQKAADKQKEVAEKQKEAYNKYLENEKLLKSSSSNVERAEAKAGMAEALATLAGIDKNNITTTNNGPILNKEYAKQRIEQLEAEQTLTEASGNFAQAILQTAEANKAEKSIRDNTAYGIYGQWNNRGGSWWEDTKWDLSHIGLTNEEEYYATLQHNAEQQAKAENYRAAAQPELMAAAASLLKDKYDENIIDNVASAYSKLVNTIDFQEQLKQTSGVGRFGGRDNIFNKGSLKQEYEAIYGVGSAKGLKVNELSTALAQRDVTKEEQERVQQLADFASDNIGKEILNALEGNGEIDETADKFANKIEELADIFGKQSVDIKKQLKEAKEARQEIKKSNQANIFEQALKSGHGVTQDFFDTIKNLDYDQLNVVSDIINQAAGKVSEQTFQSLFDTLPTMSNEALQELQGFFDNFNLDNPIQALDQLNSKIAEVGASSDFGKLLADIKETNSALFESSNLVQNFLLSESYEQLSDTIEDLTKDNKKLNGKNIEDMAESCKELDILLDELKANFEDNIDEAQALAEAINLIGEGALSIDQITSSLLAALGAGESFESMIGDVQSWVDDFDEGTDLKFGAEHIISELESLGKYVDNWEFGNEPTENIYNHLFNTKEGDNAYQKLLTKYGNDFEGLENYIEGRIETLNKWSENEGLGGIQEALSKGVTGLNEISGSGGQFFDWDLTQFSSTTDAINEVANALNISQGAAEAFILSWQTHIPKLRTEWNDLQFKDAINAFAQDLGDGTIITQQELDALAAQFGKDATDIKAAIDEVRAAAGKPITVSVDWQDETGSNLSGQGLIDEFNETVKAPTKTTTRYNGSEKETTSKTDYSKFLSEIDDVNRKVKDEFGNTFNTLDFDTLHNHLVEALKLTPAQATEVANHISEQTEQKLSKEIKVPVKLDDGTIGTETKVITATTSDSLQAGIDAAMQAANYALVAEQMADASDFSTVGSKLEAAIKTGADTLPGAVSSAAAGVSVTIPVHWKQDPLPTGNTNPVTGGVVGSYAGGSEHFHVNPGTSLTGEEGPEIIWNKDGKYAYITGQNGPEFADLHPGDRVFNAAETRRILRNSNASGGIIDSFAAGGWKNSSGSSGSGSGSGSKGKDRDSDNEKETDWRNELDWLYNLMENIVELERDQEKLQETYDDLLTDQTKTGRDLYKLLIDQLGNLYAQLDNQTYALERREQEMREFMDTTNDQDQYLWYNWEDRTLEIDWDAIDQITDQDAYDHVKELIDQAEDIQDKMDDAEDAVLDINNQIQELENIWRDTFTDFEDRVLKAVVQMYQNVIDNYSELNDTLNNSNTSILDAINKEISLQRQIRDNAKTEEEITNTEAQLAYLRRDTTGGNELAALQTEKSLDETRQNYEDNLVDQAVQRLQEDNDAAAQQRERQIEIMQAQLDYQSENGEFNAYVRDLLETAMDGDGHLATDSDLYKLLAEQENMAAMTDVQKQVWEEELNGTFKEVLAFLLKEQGQAEGTYFTAVTAAFNNISDTFKKAFHGSYSQGSHNGSSSGGGSSGGGSSGGGSSSSRSYSGGGIDIDVTVKTPPQADGSGCFAPGTQILMADYSFKNIEDVCIGEYVISYNELTFSYESKKVLHSFAHYNTNEIIDIYLSNNIVLTATKCHPILTTDGWKSLNHDIALYEHGIETKPLLNGQTIVGFEENYEIIQIINRNDLNGSTTYNITIEDNHTYIANNCIVHNMMVARSLMKYATGGLNTKTGPAWLDGTPSEPEYVLNARQTDAFLKLADVLPNMMNNSAATMNTFGGNTINIAVQLDSVSPDYDVDRMVDAVKEKLYDSGSYRNVNSISFLR